jgi:hypothetical protein
VREVESFLILSFCSDVAWSLLLVVDVANEILFLIDACAQVRACVRACTMRESAREPAVGSWAQPKPVRLNTQGCCEGPNCNQMKKEGSN